jgi:hypothetical protein
LEDGPKTGRGRSSFQVPARKIKPVLGNRFCVNTIKTKRLEKRLVAKNKKV